MPSNFCPTAERDPSKYSVWCPLWLVRISTVSCPRWAPGTIPFSPFGSYFSCLVIVSSYACPDLYSAESPRGTLCKFPWSSFCGAYRVAFFSVFCPAHFRYLGILSLSSIFLKQGGHQALPGFHPFFVSWPGNSLGSKLGKLFVSHLLEITVLHCLLPNILRLLFYIFCMGF